MNEKLKGGAGTSSRRDFLFTLGAAIPSAKLLGQNERIEATQGGTPEHTLENNKQGVRFGINSFLGNLGHSELRGHALKTTPTDRTNYLNAVQALGVSFIRETFMNWSDIEPVRGKGYLLEAFDDIATKASKRGIEIEAICYPFPNWATGHPKASPNKKYVFMGDLPRQSYEPDFRRFVRKMVSRYSGRQGSLDLKIPVRHWIFFNEPDVCPIDIVHYAHWLRVFYEEVKSVDPSSKVVAPALASPGVGHGGSTRMKITFLEELLKSPKLKGPNFPYFDVLDFHNYPKDFGIRPNVYGLNAAYGYVTKVLQLHDLNLPMWLDEIGDNSQNFNLQAENVVKYLVHAATLGFDRINLHGLWDCHGREPWGVLENTPSGKIPVRKPSFFAFQTLVGKIGQNRGIQFLGPGCYKALQHSGEPVYVLWAEGPNSNVPCFLHGKLRVTNLKNRQFEANATNLKLSGKPIFVQKSA